MLTNTLKVVQITLGSNYVKHYLGSRHAQPHAHHQHVVLAKTFFFGPYLPIYGPV